MDCALITRMILHGVGYFLLALLVLVAFYHWYLVSEWVATYVFPITADDQGVPEGHLGRALLTIILLVLLPACFIGGAVQAYNNHWRWKEKRQREANRKAESNGV